MTRSMYRATSLVVLILFALAGPTAACTFGSIPTLKEAAADADLIFIGKVTDSRGNSTYDIRVTQEIRGDVPEIVTFGSAAGGVSSCDASLDVGTSYVVGLDRLRSEPLGIGNVWFEIDGRVVKDSFLSAPDLSLTALVSYIAGLPDAALAPPRPTTPAPIVGVAMVATALWIASRRLRWRLATGDAP